MTDELGTRKMFIASNPGSQKHSINEFQSNAQVPHLVSIDTAFTRPKLIGLFIVFLVFGVFGLWSVLAPIDAAALAPGEVTVKSYKKTVQHLEGGIVADIRVRNGDFVQAGDVLLLMDSTHSLGQLAIIRNQYLTLLAKESRLLAERDGKERVIFNNPILVNYPRAVDEMSSQQQIFTARKRALEGSRRVLEQRIEQLQTKISGLQGLKESKQDLISSYSEELVDLGSLLEKGFVEKTRLRDLERNQALLQGEVAELVASMSGAQIQIGETQLQILQETKEFHAAVTDDLAQTQNSLNDTLEQMKVLENTVDRSQVKAPVSGVVHHMAVHTIGGVINAGSPIAEIVPQSEAMVIESRVSTADIDRVKIGQEAKIRFSSFNHSVPAISGRILSVSADSLVDDKTGLPYYLTRVEVTDEGLGNLQGLELMPGMPAEVFISTGSRTLFQYMIQPVVNSLARTMIED